MAKKFRPGDLVYNRDTMEDGAVLRVYETNGSTMLEVGVPKLGDSWSAGSYLSDWVEDVLQLSNNERLKSSAFRAPSPDSSRAKLLPNLVKSLSLPK
jgi:hypothetical protein